MQTLLRLCDSCRFYNEDDGSCKAFPDGIPISSKDTHFDVRDDQVGDTIYEMDMNRYDRFEDWRRVHPNVKLPVFVTYEVPTEDDPLRPADVEVEENNGQW